ncbi:MAG: UDP-N-acetylmuramoylalanine--D-glutamate ligase [Myxococcota bacterium]|jgi:UDP-N-acetylmuramoylalanine--D-glutamate ligase
MNFIEPADLENRHVLVLGLGSFGGGAGCARALHELGAKVTVSDLRTASKLETSINSLAGYPIEFVFEEHPEYLFEQADVVVVNPAVPNASPIWDLARKHNCQLTTEVNLAIAFSAHIKTVAITGTHGKSTCASILHHLLGDDSLLAGNLGGSFLEQVMSKPDLETIVVEMSSFQCERLVAPRGWPHIAVLTCFGADHLDRHGDIAGYAAAKRRLLEYQDNTCFALVPGDDSESTNWTRAANGNWMELRNLTATDFGLTLDDLPFQEAFRFPSLFAALQSARILGYSDAVLRDWPGLEHRMQSFVDIYGRKIVNNAVATHPEPTAAALASIKGKKVLLAGGQDKLLDLSGVMSVVRKKTRLHLHGAGGSRLAQMCAGAGIACKLHENFESAAAAALSGLANNETLLFSPTFSSFDEFNNFSERAQLFLRLTEDTPISKA